MKRTIIVDLDGTLFDDTRRKHYIELEDWDSYNRDHINDSINRAVYNYVQSEILGGAEIVIITGRSDKFKSTTVEQLRDLFGMDLTLLMRSEGDKQSSSEIKSYLVDWLRRPIALAIDDDIRNIEMFKSKGIDTFHYIRSSK